MTMEANVNETQSPVDGAVRSLVVDDGAMNRRLAERMLRHLGCEVFTAEDAFSAIEILRTNEIDIVFSDVTMPDLDGADAVQLFRENAQQAFPDRIQPIAVVAVSGDALGDDRKTYREAGFDEYLPKPISVEALRDYIARWSDADKP